MIPGLILILMLAAGGTAAPAATRADDALAEVARYRGWNVTSFEVKGLPQGMTAEVRSGLALRGRRSLLRTRRPPLFRHVLADDLQRTRSYLAGVGYPWARIRVVFEPERKDGKVGMTFVVDPGPPVVVDAVTVSGLPDGLGSEAGALVAGRRFTEGDLNRQVRRLEERLAGAGYPRAAVVPGVTMRDSSRAAVGIVVTPGPWCTIGSVVPSGAPDDLERLVMKNVRWAGGRPYDPEILRDARRNLRELDLFRRIDVTTGDPHEGTVVMHVDLLERKPRTAEFDLGYWTDDFLRAGARWRHRNLFGGGRGLELKGTLSRFRRDGAVTVWWPSLFGPRTRLSTRLNYEQEREEGYDLDNAQAELWASKRMGRNGRLQAGLTVADVDLVVRTSDPASFQAQSGLLTSLHLRANLDDVDDPVNPARGMSWSGGVEWSPPSLPSDNSFVLGTTELAAYRPAGSSVFAGRLELGLAGPLGDSLDLLPNKRFFAGGSSSMRGAKRRMLGPTGSDGSPVGGEGMVLASFEWRQPLKGRVGGVLFLDAGNVWPRVREVSLNDLEFAVGPGMSVATPVGPVRVDGGFALGGRPAGEPGFILHVSVGHPF